MLLSGLYRNDLVDLMSFTAGGGMKSWEMAGMISTSQEFFYLLESVVTTEARKNLCKRGDNRRGGPPARASLRRSGRAK